MNSGVFGPRYFMGLQKKLSQFEPNPNKILAMHGRPEPDLEFIDENIKNKKIPVTQVDPNMTQPEPDPNSSYPNKNSGYSD